MRSWSQAPPMLIHKYMDENGLTAMHGHQDVSRCFSRGESDDSVPSKQDDPPWLSNPRQMSPEVLNKGISGPTKRTSAFKIKKKEQCHHPNGIGTSGGGPITSTMASLECPSHQELEFLKENLGL